MAIAFLGLCIIVASWSISSSLDKASTGKHRYEFISANERNVIIFDKETGSYWRKVFEPSEGPTEWQKQDSPIPTEKQR